MQYQLIIGEYITMSNFRRSVSPNLVFSSLDPRMSSAGMSEYMSGFQKDSTFPDRLSYGSRQTEDQLKTSVLYSNQTRGRVQNANSNPSSCFQQSYFGQAPNQNNVDNVCNTLGNLPHSSYDIPCYSQPKVEYWPETPLNIESHQPLNIQLSSSAHFNHNFQEIIMQLLQQQVKRDPQSQPAAHLYPPTNYQSSFSSYSQPVRLVQPVTRNVVLNQLPMLLEFSSLIQQLSCVSNSAICMLYGKFQQLTSLMLNTAAQSMFGMVANDHHGRNPSFQLDRGLVESLVSSILGGNNAASANNFNRRNSGIQLDRGFLESLVSSILGGNDAASANNFNRRNSSIQLDRGFLESLVSSILGGNDSASANNLNRRNSSFQLDRGVLESLVSSILSGNSTDLRSSANILINLVQQRQRNTQATHDSNDGVASFSNESGEQLHCSESLGATTTAAGNTSAGESSAEITNSNSCISTLTENRTTGNVSNSTVICQDDSECDIIIQDIINWPEIHSFPQSDETRETREPVCPAKKLICETWFKNDAVSEDHRYCSNFNWEPASCFNEFEQLDRPTVTEENEPGKVVGQKHCDPSKVIHTETAALEENDLDEMQYKNDVRENANGCNKSEKSPTIVSQKTINFGDSYFYCSNYSEKIEYDYDADSEFDRQTGKMLERNADEMKTTGFVSKVKNKRSRKQIQPSKVVNSHDVSSFANMDIRISGVHSVSLKAATNESRCKKISKRKLDDEERNMAKRSRKRCVAKFVDFSHPGTPKSVMTSTEASKGDIQQEQNEPEVKISLLTNVNKIVNPVVRTYQNKNLFQFHLIFYKFIQSERVQCLFCPLSTLKQDQTNDHMMNCHGNLLFVMNHARPSSKLKLLYLCRHCQFVAFNNIIALFHFKVYHNVSGILTVAEPPSNINWTSTQLPQLLPTSTVGNEETSCICPECKIIFADVMCLVDHLIMEHSNTPSVTGCFVNLRLAKKPDDIESITYGELVNNPDLYGGCPSVNVCRICSYVTLSSYMALKHNLTQHCSVKLLFVCCYCPYNSIYYVKLARHVGEQHRFVSSQVCSMTVFDTKICVESAIPNNRDDKAE